MRAAVAAIALIVAAALLLPPFLPWHYAAIDWDAVRVPAFSPAIRSAPTASAATCSRARWPARA
ncbi:MAG: hypothetical protein WDN24_22330 [Sphingomonas sp.]